VYRALLAPPQHGSPLAGLAVGQTLEITTPIGRQPHPRLGAIWCAAVLADPCALPACSRFTLVTVRPEGCLVEVAIATGRPHQIRIHAAAGGAPLLGDPLYRAGGLARADALPGDGGYRLHAHRITLRTAEGVPLRLEAPLPCGLAQDRL
jgi:23S rRNA pseudouridine1911/1915/1917 synthase